VVAFAPCIHEGERLSELGCQARLVVTAHVQAAAPRRPIGREGGDDDCASWHDSPLDRFDVSFTLAGFEKEVEECAIVPDVERAERLSVQYVADHPADRVSPVRQSGLRPLDRAA